MAKDWGVEDERSVIFMGRLRIIESAEESDDDEDESGPKEVKVDVRIEDKDSGELFANCPYEVSSVAEAHQLVGRSMVVMMGYGLLTVWLVTSLGGTGLRFNSFLRHPGSPRPSESNTRDWIRGQIRRIRFWRMSTRGPKTMGHRQGNRQQAQGRTSWGREWWIPVDIRRLK